MWISALLSSLPRKDLGIERHGVMLTTMKTTSPIQQVESTPRVVWIFNNSMDKLDAVTWLIPTQEMMTSGWQVTLMAAGNPKQTQVGGVPVHHVARPDVFFIRQVIFHFQVIRSLYGQLGNIDILLFHEASSLWLLLFMMYMKLIRKKRPLFVMDTRTLPMEPEDKATWRDKMRGTLALQMNKFANHAFDGRTAITQRMAESLKIPNEKLWGVWPSGVKLEDFSDALRLRNWPKRDEPIELLYIGCMHYERNLLTLSKAVTQANASGHLFTLRIVGDGNARQELEDYAQKQGKHIQIIPPVSHEEIPKWLAGAHVGVLPFPDEEKFRVSSPIKLFEYLAAGLPVLATKIVCHTDVVGDHPVAFWAKSSDTQGLFEALIEVYENREKLSSMGQESARLAHHWTWKSSANKLKSALAYGFRKGKS